MVKPTVPVIALGLMIAGCGGTSATVDGLTATPDAAPPGTGCLDTRAATTVWHQVNRRLNAVSLDPGHRGLVDAAGGAAALSLRRYIDEELVAKHLTEREEDRLDSLTVIQAGCNGGPLVVEIRQTLTRDDYLTASGAIDHVDAKVGTQIHSRDTYLQAESTWKLNMMEDLDAPDPSAPSQTA